MHDPRPDALRRMAQKLCELGYASEAQVSHGAETLRIVWTPAGRELRSHLIRIMNGVSEAVPGAPINALDIEMLFAIALLPDEPDDFGNIMGDGLRR